MIAAACQGVRWSRSWPQRLQRKFPGRGTGIFGIRCWRSSELDVKLARSWSPPEFVPGNEWIRFREAKRTNARSSSAHELPRSSSDKMKLRGDPCRRRQSPGRKQVGKKGPLSMRWSTGSWRTGGERMFGYPVSFGQCKVPIPLGMRLDRFDQASPLDSQLSQDRWRIRRDCSGFEGHELVLCSS